eukprot:TRINITY_DN13153_c0_g1_i1.p1 TRINITY_DN13153_c0_g1~~TRINITY_DN13153_c0_g1_i1.p1  ORF type:complete len:227 (-),score=12.63 TRINITY_DN13153_c0_g1_i1:401-1081(-)
MTPFQLPSAALLISVVLTCLAIPRVAGAYYEIREFAEVISPKGPRQSELPSKLGGVFSFNNDIRIGDKSGATVGFTNGNCLVSAEVSTGIANTLYTCYETVLFTSGPYQGSSLTIVGFYDFVANGPLSIVGGTGLFRGATGELNYVYPTNSNFSYSLPNMVFVTANFPSPTSPPQAASATLTPSSAPPTTCDTGSDKPNQCFNADGSSFICCAGACGPSGATATCT